MRRSVNLAKSLLSLVSLVAMSATLLLATPVITTAEDVVTANRIKAITSTLVDGTFSVLLETEQNLTGRYSTHELNDPDRIVVDLPGLDISGATPAVLPAGAPVSEVRTSALDLNSGKIGRVELVRPGNSPYKVSVDGKILTVSFSGQSEKTAEQTVGVTPEKKGEQTPPVVGAQAATKILAVDKAGTGVILKTNGALQRFETMTLKKPARFVVDCYGVKQGFKGQVKALSGGVAKVRFGSYPDKVRFVFEGDGKALAKAVAFPVEGGLKVQWDGKRDGEVNGGVAVAAPLASATEPKPEEYQPKNRPGILVVDNIDFKVDNGNTLIIVELSKPGQVMQPIKDKTLVRFGIQGAAVSPALRRTIDASAFPSAVRQVTPYMVSTKGRTDVRFAVELKGDAQYRLLTKGNLVTLVVENGRFAEGAKSGADKIEVDKVAPVVSQAVSPIAVQESKVDKSDVAETQVVDDEVVKSKSPQKKYTGQIVSLNFDNVEIRNLLLLIAEVSDRNIIASEDVKGTMTLRLNNVPWDQALEVILQIRGLGMKEEGNIVRIMPLEKLRAMDLEALKSTAEIEKVEPLVTETFTINFTELSNIEAPVKNIMTARGKIHKDERTKKIFITDVASVFDKIKIIIKELDVKEKQIVIEARIVEVDSRFTNEFGVKWGLSQNNLAKGPLDLNSNNLTLGGSGNFLVPVISSSTGGISNALSFGKVGDSTILDLRLRAIETSLKGKVVSTPKVTTLNGQEATIEHGQSIPYKTVDDSGKTKTTFEKAPLLLKVTPTINPDNSVHLKVHVENSSIGAQTPDGLAINKKQVDTNLIVQNGETMVIGGSFKEEEIENEEGVPLLMHIPILGNLFKWKTKIKNKIEMLIFITPTSVL